MGGGTRRERKGERTGEVEACDKKKKKGKLKKGTSRTSTDKWESDIMHEKQVKRCEEKL